jgi:ABC-type oligopeptide transport system substrate-binding subunit
MTKPHPHRFAKRALIAALASTALVAGANLQAKTLVFCSEGSPENFYPAVNTTGTSFDANSQIYSRIVDFERGGTTVASPRSGTSRPTARCTRSICARASSGTTIVRSSPRAT